MKVAVLMTCLFGLAAAATTRTTRSTTSTTTTTAPTTIGPIITAWQKSTGNGWSSWSGIAADIISVSYTSQYVYVSANSIPSYSIGPTWPGNTPSSQNDTWSFYRTPTYKSGTKTKCPMGTTGLWINGVAIYNPDDAQTYNDYGVWSRNAYFFEGSFFDSCEGHASSDGRYHHHINPTCLYSSSDSSTHSPIIG